MASNLIWARRLREARVAKNLSQRQLGIEAGLDPSVASTRINRYEMGVHRADFRITEKVAQVLAIPVAYLYAESDALAQMVLLFDRSSPAQQLDMLEWAGKLKRNSL